MIIALFCDMGECFYRPYLRGFVYNYFDKERPFLLRFSGRVTSDRVTPLTSSPSVRSECVDLRESLCFYQQSSWFYDRSLEEVSTLKRKGSDGILVGPFDISLLFPAELFLLKYSVLNCSQNQGPHLL